MNKEEYQHTQDLLFIYATGLSGLDLDGFIAAGERATIVVPLTDPTLCRDGQVALHRILDLARAAKKVQEAHNVFKQG